MKLFFTLASLAAILTTANATIRVVTCQNSPSHFLPVTVNAVVGDTISWEWVAGTHVVGPMSASDIPNGAAMFNAPIDFNYQGFMYVVTVVGMYHYECHPSTPHGEPGYINVTSGTGVPSLNTHSLSAAYPNPFFGKITIQTPPADAVVICNVLGEKIKSITLKSGQTEVEVDAAALDPGIYFYSIIKEGVIAETKKLVKE